MKGDRYQPRGSIREVLVGALTIGQEGHVAESDAEASILDGVPSLVAIAAAPEAAAPAAKPKTTRSRKPKAVAA